MKSPPSDVRWVNTDGIHLTLKFLGALDEERIPELADIIERCCTGCTPFTLTVRTLGAFPNEKNPKVIWVGAEEKTGTLARLQQDLEKKLSAIGFKEEKRTFFPHLTLGRLKSPKGERELTQSLAEYKDCECGTLEAHEVCLFKSDLRPGGAVYTKLRTFPFH